MPRTVNIMLISLMVVLCLHLAAQQKGKAGAAGRSVKTFEPTVYLGRSDRRGGPLKKDEFNMLLKQGLTSRDSLGNKYRVTGFDFVYGERNLYEDSTGTLKVLVDINTEHCYGDTITHDMAVTVHAEQSRTGEEAPGIYDRIKPGDTIYFDHIKLERIGKNSVLSIPDSIPIAGKPMKFYIIR